MRRVRVWFVVSKVLPVVVIAVALNCWTPSGVFGRAWKTRDGTYSREAEFVDFNGDTIVLKKTDGLTVLVESQRLSDADNQFVARAITERNGSLFAILERAVAHSHD